MDQHNTQTPNFLNEDQKKRAGEMVDNVLEKVFLRIAHVLTEEDIQLIDQLNQNDQTGDAVKFFLMGKIPNFEAIVEEELLDKA